LRLSRTEELEQRLDVIPIGSDRNFVDGEASKEVAALISLFCNALLEFATHD
jgi:hypothetical protein